MVKVLTSPDTEIQLTPSGMKWWDGDMDVRKIPPSERKQLIREKLNTNLHRNLRLRYLAELPSELKAQLESVPFITSPEADPIIREWFLLLPEGIGEEPRQPDGFHYATFDDDEVGLLRAIRDVGSALTKRDVYFQSGVGPLFDVQLNWVLDHLDTLWKATPLILGIVSTDFSFGILVSSYSGDEPGIETTYELGHWGS